MRGSLHNGRIDSVISSRGVSVIETRAADCAGASHEQPDLKAYLRELEVLDRVRKESHEILEKGRAALFNWMGSERFESYSSDEQIVAARVHWRASEGLSGSQERLSFA